LGANQIMSGSMGRRGRRPGWAAAAAAPLQYLSRYSTDTSANLLPCEDDILNGGGKQTSSVIFRKFMVMPGGRAGIFGEACAGRGDFHA